MIFLAVIELVLIFICAESSINEGLPDWIPRDGGWIDYLYRAIRMIAVWFIFGFGIPSKGIFVLIGIALFGVAYGIKKIFWKKRYGDYLD